ncbi:MAG: 1-deoxy-D-xylulose-5-phosphate synthase [Lentisphaerae bacterium GWF2_52_8]|nr:MAG: 1-deoxy-D-xylulose-5-phosphate synthase [Lentisphaerae bacterium GWF2_52_8]
MKSGLKGKIEQEKALAPVLPRINSPADLKGLSLAELEKLAGEIRDELVDVVSKNGGHLAPNLGIVELSIALHCAFNAPEDKFVWDVGHQSYVHKLLTGRREIFRTLRQFGGCLGFTSREESPYDTFIAGHAGTAISAALGMAVARDRKGGNEKVLAIVGDGSLNCGISLEGLNNVAEATKDIVIILNDNKMSISPNVGAIPRYLNRMISGRGYNRFKALARVLLKKIPHGDEIHRKLNRFEEATKGLFVPGVFFEELGLRYIGPIDGHNIEEMLHTFNGLKEFKRPVLIHVLTQKGRGYAHAEAAPEKFHGLSCFDPDTGQSTVEAQVASFSSAFGSSVCELAPAHPELCVITAAMRSGTGLKPFSEKFPDQFFDVGIAEEHAVVFAAGLAVSGQRPVVAMYATFLQRALDCVLHDVCLQNLPVIFCLDRAGIVDDGPTHHGIHELSFLLNMPNLAILSPRDETELRLMLFASYERKSPLVIRYPRGSSGRSFDPSSAMDIPWGKAQLVQDGQALAIFASGREVETALSVASMLKERRGISCAVINVRFLKPFDAGMLLDFAARMPVATIEDCQINGGLGMLVAEALLNAPHHKVMHFGWGDDVIPHGQIEKIRKAFHMTAADIADSIDSCISSN